MYINIFKLLFCISVISLTLFSCLTKYRFCITGAIREHVKKYKIEISY